ncbi:hypothetical protein HPP92_023253 [Vanilla planifolia]|uniref:Pentatricopeptide repeat-containing protein n=1 Tax=Vanilla planifolia TaxID=51239 RepID=A0A835PWX3_VANPL|nr:hypothetical protein HPP92_023253 [Vanilla planifolia]
MESTFREIDGIVHKGATTPWQRCMSLVHRHLNERQLHAAHALFLTHGLCHNTVAISRLILAACSLGGGGGLFYASLILRHSVAPPNSFIYNSLIHAHARGADPYRALHYFRLMLRSPNPSAAPNHHSYPFALAACIAIPSFFSGTQIHSLIVRNGLASADHYVQTAALRLYTQTQNDISQAQKLFDEFSQRDAVHLDILMTGYIRHGFAAEASCLFQDALAAGFELDKHVITTALTACSHAGDLKQGNWIHSYLVEKHSDFLKDTFIGSALISMYAKCGCIDEAVKVFDTAPERNSFLWAAMVGGFAVHGFANDAILCLSRMQDEDGLRPDGITIRCHVCLLPRRCCRQWSEAIG